MKKCPPFGSSLQNGARPHRKARAYLHVVEFIPCARPGPDRRRRAGIALHRNRATCRSGQSLRLLRSKWFALERTRPSSPIESPFPEMQPFSVNSGYLRTIGDGRVRLFPGPAGSALVEEGRDAFLRVGSERVHAHHLFGVCVGFGLIEIDLRVVVPACPERPPEVLASAMRPASCAFPRAVRPPARRVDQAPVGGCGARPPISPVSSIWSARLRPTARLEATMGVVQNRPMRTPGVAKAAWSEAMARSQVATSWHPAAVAMPCTSAITGCGMACIFIINSRADVEEPPVFVDIAADHLGEIVTGQKPCLPRPG